MKAFSIEIKWGIIFTVVGLLWMVLEKSLGWHDELISKHPIYTNIFAVIAIAIFVVALMDKKKNYYNGQMNWTQGFLAGVIITIIIALLSPLAQWVSFNYITPDYFENAINHSVINKFQTKAEAEAYFNFKSYMLQAALGGLSVGVITSAIIALIVRNKPSTTIK